MISIELKPRIMLDDIKKAVEKITGMTPTITICSESRIAMTIEKELTPDEQNQISHLALLPVRDLATEVDEIKKAIGIGTTGQTGISQRLDNFGTRITTLETK